MGVDMGNGQIPHPKKGQTAEDCKAKAEAGEGAHSFDEFGQACWKVYGKEIKINPLEDSIMKGFQITNLNFSVASASAPAASSSGLPGPKSGNIPSSPNLAQQGIYQGI
jgi:hypothetical protein